MEVKFEMSETSATVKTTNGLKYMKQLCKHWSHRFTTKLNGDRGSADLPNGKVSFTASTETLHISIALNDETAKSKMQDVVSEHLNRFAFREAPLTFDWT